MSGGWICKEASGFDYYIDIEVAPWKVGWIFFGEYTNVLAVDYDALLV